MRLIPWRRERSDRDVIAASPFFDEAYYRTAAQLAPGADAASHYLEAGAAAGLEPSEKFSGEEYLTLNPDVAAAGMNPLLHYERFGRAEGRRVGKAITWSGDYREHRGLRSAQRFAGRLVCAGKIRRNSQARILVVLHLFYSSAIPEIVQYLHNLDAYDHVKIIVTYVESFVSPQVLAPFDEFSDVELRPFGNKGYDLGPFLDVLDGIDLADYDVVFKLHSKSTDRERLVYGSRFAKREWFLRLYDGMLGPTTVHAAIDLLMGDEHCGLVADRKLLSLFEPDHVRRMVAEKLRARGLGEPVKDYRFVAGTCFAARADALRSLQTAGLSLDDFANVRYGIFSLAHALERFVGSELMRQGYELHPLTTHRLWAWRSQRIADKRYQANGQRIKEQLGLRFSDDDLLCLDGTFFASWGVERVALRGLLTRDASYDLITLGEAYPNYVRKYGDSWERSEELSRFVGEHFMRGHDEGLAGIDEMRWSQAIVLNQDYYIMCGHDVAYELCLERGVDAEVEVIRFVS